MCELNKLQIDDREYETRLTKKFSGRKAYEPPDPKKLLAHIPGVIRKIYVEAGQSVARGQSLLILEAMKMQNDVVARDSGTVKAIAVVSGQMVPKGQLMIEFE
jgi:pyruvate carboxylase